MGGAGSLVVGEEEDLIFSNRAPNRPPELVLVEFTSRRREIIASIEIGVSNEFENIAMKCVRSRFGNDVDLAATEFAVLGVENSVKSRTSYGGTAPVRVKEALQAARGRFL